MRKANDHVLALNKINQSPNLFWNLVDKTGFCWEWTGWINADGYGRFSVFGQKILSHRVAFFLSNGFLDQKDLILHSCDNRKCCNPSHLRAGTHKDNMADMKNRGRTSKTSSKKNSEHWNAKLNFEVANEIRSYKKIGMLEKDIAKYFSVSNSTVNKICRGVRWV